MRGTRLNIDTVLRRKHPGLNALILRIEGAKVQESNQDLEEFKIEVTERIGNRWTLEHLKEEPILRAYRDFFWRINIDPTKIRPAAEALIRRVLRGTPLPTINTFVDAYNLASIETGVALAAFDMERITGDLLMRGARPDEKFLGIGMDRPLTLEPGEIVIEDGKTLIAVYPYRDAESAKITTQTKRATMLVCGVPGIEEARLQEAAEVTGRYVTRFCGGALS